MILLKDIRDFVVTFGITVDDNCYCGKLDNKKLKSIGTYPLKRNTAPKGTVGGDKNKSYLTKGISFLVHWNKFPTDTEEAANKLYEKLKKTRMEEINGHTIKFVQMQQEEPIWVGTDESGVFEYVIECLFYFDKQEGES